MQIQDQLPYMEPDFWYYPVRQSLGATPADGRASRGRGGDVPRGADRRAEQRLGAVGPDGSAEGRGDQAAAEQTARLFDKAWAGSAPPDLARL